MEFIRRSIRGNDMLSVARQRPFSLLMISEFFSQLAFNMQHFVLIFVIYELTRSNTAVSGVILSFTIPALLFSFITGVYVDRWNKKRVLFITNLLRGLLLIPFFFSDLHIGLIYTLTFLVAVATQFFLPAESSIIPKLVKKDHLLAANAIFSFGIYGTTLFGYILSGPVILLLGKTNTFVFLSVLFFISALVILFIKIPKKKKINPEASNALPSFWNEAREIFDFIRKTRKVMHALVMLTIAQAVIFMFAVLVPGYAATVLKIRLESLSWILITPAALGMGLGALTLGGFGKKFNRKWLSSLGFMITGVTFIFFSLVNLAMEKGFFIALNKNMPDLFHITPLHFVIVMAVVIGFAISLVFAPSNTTLQLETDESMRGRIYGFLNALIGAVSFLPVILAGGLADILGTVAVLVGAGVSLLLLGIFFWVFD
ncbi:MAG: MFS transporter [Patescibacteria group bacterium]